MFILDLKWLEVNRLHKLVSTILFIFSSFYKKKISVIFHMLYIAIYFTLPLSYAWHYLIN